MKALKVADCHSPSDTGFELREDLLQLNETQKVILRNTSAESRENFQTQLENIRTLSSRQVLNTSTTTEIVSRSEAALGKVKEGVDGFRTESAALHASTRQDIEGLSSRMEKLSNLSEEQSETFELILGQLQYLLTTDAEKQPRGSEVHEMPATSAKNWNSRALNEDSMNQAEEELGASLERLCSLAVTKERTVFSKEAQNIIEDVELLLNAVSSTREARDCKDRGKKRRWSPDYGSDSDVLNDEEHQYKRGVKRLKGVLATSQCITVNSKGVYLVHCHDKRQYFPNHPVPYTNYLVSFYHAVLQVYIKSCKNENSDVVRPNSTFRWVEKRWQNYK